MSNLSSSTAPWVGPGTYENIDPVSLRGNTNVSCQNVFKTVPRYPAEESSAVSRMEFRNRYDNIRNQYLSESVCKVNFSDDSHLLSDQLSYFIDDSRDSYDYESEFNDVSSSISEKRNSNSFEDSAQALEELSIQINRSSDAKLQSGSLGQQPVAYKSGQNTVETYKDNPAFKRFISTARLGNHSFNPNASYVEKLKINSRISNSVSEFASKICFENKRKYNPIRRDFTMGGLPDINNDCVCDSNSKSKISNVNSSDYISLSSSVDDGLDAISSLNVVSRVSRRKRPTNASKSAENCISLTKNTIHYKNSKVIQEITSSNQTVKQLLHVKSPHEGLLVLDDVQSTVNKVEAHNENNVDVLPPISDDIKPFIKQWYESKHIAVSPPNSAASRRRKLKASQSPDRLSSERINLTGLLLDEVAEDKPLQEIES